MPRPSERGRLHTSPRVPAQIAKRDGSVVPFNKNLIESALWRCFREPEVTRLREERGLLLPAVRRVVDAVVSRLPSGNGRPPTVEDVQDLVERVLQEEGEYEAAKHYILYRADHARLRDKRPIPKEVRASFGAASQYFPTPLQQFQFFDKYSRFDYALGRRETWVETVDRAVSFLIELSQGKLPLEVFSRLRQGILEMRVLPSMRLLAMAGPAARRNHIALYNCAFASVSDVSVFVEALLISMAGCGLGYSVERRYVDQLPLVALRRGDTPLVHQVEDSAEGWGEALRVGLAAWFSGGDVLYDFSRVRPPGAPLRTKGGRASGPEALRVLLAFIRAKIFSRQGQRLRPLDAHDMMCAVGGAAVSGGVRRTALLCLFDLDDVEMRTCKAGDLSQNPQRWNANNSAVWPEEGIRSEQYLRVMLELYESQRGEPGIFNRRAAWEGIPERRKRFGYRELGCNPCFSSGTLVQTREGHFPIELLVGRSVEIWEGSQWQRVDNFRVMARNQPILKMVMQDGSELGVTSYHSMILEDGRRVEAREVRPGMRLARSQAPETHGTHREPGAYLKGFLVADGTRADDRAALALYAPKFGCVERLIESAAELSTGAVRTNALTELGFRADVCVEGRSWMTGLAPLKEELLPWATSAKRQLPAHIFSWSFESKREFIAGLMDGDGSASDTKNGFMYQVTGVDKRRLQDFQTLLKTVGVSSKLALMKVAGRMDFGDGYGEYETRDCFRLTISRHASIALAKQVQFSRLVSFADKRVVYHTQSNANRVEQVLEDGVQPEVYCCTVDGSHSLALSTGFQVGQCGEILLRDQSFCNLTAMIARADDTPETLAEKVELATILGTIQSTATHFPGLRPGYKQNCEEERLLGVDITGQMDAPVVRDAGLLSRLRARATEVNEGYARALDIAPSAAITCVKPSGNSSTLVDCASGLHARYARFYLRRVRVAAHSPLLAVFRDAGVPLVPEVGQTPETATTWVVAFPVKAPEGAITRRDLSAIQQLEHWLLNKRSWTDHNPSASIYYTSEEMVAVLAWVWEHRDEIGGLSFLPVSGARYDLMPYEEITEEDYERLLAEFPPVDFAKVYRYEVSDQTESASTPACDSDKCEFSK